MKELEQFKIN